MTARKTQKGSKIASGAFLLMRIFFSQKRGLLLFVPNALARVTLHIQRAIVLKLLFVLTPTSVLLLLIAET